METTWISSIPTPNSSDKALLASSTASSSAMILICGSGVPSEAGGLDNGEIVDVGDRMVDVGSMDGSSRLLSVSVGTDVKPDSGYDDGSDIGSDDVSKIGSSEVPVGVSVLVGVSLTVVHPVRSVRIIVINGTRYRRAVILIPIFFSSCSRSLSFK